MKTEYTLGFVFSANKVNVMLIEKQKPDWQKGKLNGIGGHIEKGETPLEAMIRECKEETNLDITNWQPFLVMEGDNFQDEKWKVHCFRAFDNSSYKVLFETKEGKVKLYDVEEIIKGEHITIPNLKWLIPMCLDNNNYNGYRIKGEIK